MMDDGTSTKLRIPLSAVQVAEAAKHIQDEFDSTGELRFAQLSHSEPLFGGDFNGPSSWVYHIRVFGNDVVRVPQLYMTVSNRSEHRLVRYDTATLPGGVALDLKHINFERESNVFDKSITAYTEHLGIGLTPKVLAEYIDKPMRIKVSNPRESAAADHLQDEREDRQNDAHVNRKGTSEAVDIQH
ncbi:hypothetical protein GTP44_07435 [Duganella sp. FT50W]|uniref:Uncharacterized protein n=1 Tax=Duganella lactea TaxID=2692173 RepID=A0A6L8MH62_9BURK|nr:hypothetical protein [Duganella lactea]MYM81789.1 hypothetical protein [Duganella lactea]